MNALRFVRELLLVAILSAVAVLLIGAILAPELYGRWLQKIDTARFEMLDCDCTEPLE